MEREWRIFAEYQTKDENDILYTVIEWREIMIISHIRGTVEEREIDKRWSLIDGTRVNYRDEDSFQIIETNVVLWKF